MIDGGEEDEKIIAIPVNDPYLNNYKNISIGDEIIVKSLGYDKRGRLNLSRKDALK